MASNDFEFDLGKGQFQGRGIRGLCALVIALGFLLGLAWSPSFREIGSAIGLGHLRQIFASKFP